MKAQGYVRGIVLSLLTAALFGLEAPIARASESPLPGLTTVNLNRGESYLIRGTRPEPAPEITPVDNPQALIVNRQPDGSLLILAAEAGSEKVRVTMADGSVRTLAVTVSAAATPGNPLLPGAAAEAGSVSAESPASVPLDPGAGPVDGSRPEVIAGPAPSATLPTPPQAAPASVIPSQSAGAASTLESAPSPEASPAKLAADPPVAAGTEDQAAPTTGRLNYLPEDAITMLFGTSRVFEFPQRIKRVSIADSEVADIQVVDPHQLMLVGHKPGFTTLAVWDDQGHFEERQVRIEQTGHQQVLLSCTVAEVDRTRLENQGINYSTALANSGLSLVGLPGTVATPYSTQSNLNFSSPSGATNGGLLPSGGALLPLLLSSSLTYGLATQNGQWNTETFFRYLEDHQLARILAEPQILANSGQEAKFLSGGEIPIVIAQALNTSIVFKQFGTSVVFIPTVIGRSDIELVVKPEVSKPDFTQGVQLFGFTVPAFAMRRAETVVRMKDDQTLIIAGLILTDRHAEVQKVPYLGDVPWLGGFFRTTSYQNDKTELVISVRPQIVAALPQGAQAEYPFARAMAAQELATRRLSQPDAARPRF